MPRCDDCYAGSCKRRAWWAFPTYLLLTGLLLGHVLYTHFTDGRDNSFEKVELAWFGACTYVYWTHWSGRAFRKKAARARVVSRPKR